MEVEVLSKNEMKPNRNAPSTNPTSLLKGAIKKHDRVLEFVWVSDSSPRVYECKLDFHKLKRKRKKRFENQNWYGAVNSEITKEVLVSIGKHTHGASDYEHEIFICDDNRIWETLTSSLLKRGSSEYAERILDGELEELRNELKDKVDKDIWALDDLSDYWGSTKGDIAKYLFKLTKYAKKTGLTIDAALTALTLKKPKFHKELKASFVVNSDKRGWERINQLYEALKERGDLD